MKTSCIMGYFKNITDHSSNDLKYDELKWSITHLNGLESEGRVTVVDSVKDQYMLKLNPCGVKVLVFPDEKTKIQTFKDTRFSKLI